MLKDQTELVHVHHIKQRGKERGKDKTSRYMGEIDTTNEKVTKWRKNSYYKFPPLTSTEWSQSPQMQTLWKMKYIKVLIIWRIQPVSGGRWYTALKSLTQCWMENRAETQPCLSGNGFPSAVNNVWVCVLRSSLQITLHPSNTSIHANDKCKYLVVTNSFNVWQFPGGEWVYVHLISIANNGSMSPVLFILQ